MTKKQKGEIVVDRLKIRYANAICSLVYNKEKPYELLISTRLSAQCTDARVNIVTKELFSHYQTLESFANADIKEVEKLIYSCGFYKTKAQSIINMANELIDRHNGALPDNMDDLLALSGIGRKTANLILGDIFKKPAIVADTHCIRINGRLGLTDGTKDPYKTEIQLKKIIPQNESSDFCHRLVMFGRDVCCARNPKCDICEMHDICPYFANPMNKKE